MHAEFFFFLPSYVVQVNQMLVDDGLVECEKIGSTNWYWSFPSKQAQGLSVHATSLTESVVCERAAIAETKTRLESASAVRPESDDRSAKLQQLSALKSDISEFERQVEALKENDPAEIEKMENNITLCRDASNRWTDNLLQVRTWMVKKKGMSTKEAKDTLKQMGVPTELDYVK